MTKIIISAQDNAYDICVCGHADKVNSGEGNILCAAVSMLAQTMIQMLRDMESKEIIKHKEQITDGMVRLICVIEEEHKKYVKGVISTIETGFLLLQEKYAENIVVVGDGVF